MTYVIRFIVANHQPDKRKRKRKRKRKKNYTLLPSQFSPSTINGAFPPSIRSPASLSSPETPHFSEGNPQEASLGFFAVPLRSRGVVIFFIRGTRPRKEMVCRFSIGCSCDVADAVSTSRRALKGAKIPESDFTTLPNGLKYYDLKVGGGLKAVKGSRVAVHYVAKWRNVTFMTSRQGLGVVGGTPYGFDVGQSERGTVLKGLDFGVEGMRVGGQRLLIVPPELAYGSKGVQEIPPNATIELDVELLSIKQSPFGTGVKIIEG